MSLKFPIKKKEQNTTKKETKSMVSIHNTKLVNAQQKKSREQRFYFCFPLKVTVTPTTQSQQKSPRY